MSGTHTHGSPSPGTQPPPGRQSNVLDSFDVPINYAMPALATQKGAQFVASSGDPDNIIALANYMDATLDPKTLDLAARLVNSIGQLLGEEVIRVMDNIERTASEVRIWI